VNDPRYPGNGNGYFLSRPYPIYGKESGGAEDLRLNPAIIKIIFAVLAVSFLIIMAFIYFNSGDREKPNYTIEYNSGDGIITIGLNTALQDDEWRARIYYYDDYDEHTIIKDAKIIVSEDRMKITLKERSLVNLDNNTYHIRLSSDSHGDMEFSFTFNDHQFSTIETVWIGICIVLAVLIIGFVIIKKFGGAILWFLKKPK